MINGPLPKFHGTRDNLPRMGRQNFSGSLDGAARADARSARGMAPLVGCSRR
jgi:hypothetical protein